MTKEEAKIVLLQHALQDAQHLVSFLHGCLTLPNYKYAYPESTARRLEEWGKLAPIDGTGCHHSMTKPDCPSCVAGQKMRQEHMEALKVLEND